MMLLHKQYNLTNYLLNDTLTVPITEINQEFESVLNWYITKNDPSSKNYGARQLVIGKLIPNVGLVIDFSQFQIDYTKYVLTIYGVSSTNENGNCLEEYTFTQEHHWVLPYTFDITSTQPLLYNIYGDDLIIDGKVAKINYDIAEKEVHIYFKEVVTGTAILIGKCTRDNNGNAPLAIINSLIPN